MKARGVRAPTALRAASIGALYGAAQAVVPPVEELFASTLLHFVLLAVFVGRFVPWRRPVGAVLAVGGYLSMLGVAAVLPFKVMDTRVEFRSTAVALSEVASVLHTSGWSVRIVPPLLPDVTLVLRSTRPSIQELHSALSSQWGIDLRKMAGCANGQGISFLWGSRVDRRLLLTPTDRAAWQRLEVLRATQGGSPFKNGYGRRERRLSCDSRPSVDSERVPVTTGYCSLSEAPPLSTTLPTRPLKATAPTGADHFNGLLGLSGSDSLSLSVGAAGHRVADSSDPP